MQLPSITKMILSARNGIVFTGSAFIVLTSAFAQGAHDAALKQVEPRIRAIYEQGAYRARPFRAEWLSDSSGYEVLERVAGSRDQKWVRIGTDGSIKGACGTSKNKKNPDRCLPLAKAKRLTKKQRAATARKKKASGGKKQFVANTKAAKNA